MKSVNVIGGTLIDLNFGLPKQFFHRYQQAAKIELPFGEKLLTEGYDAQSGGSGANVAAGLTHAGLKVWFHTGLADDVFGAFLRSRITEIAAVLDAGSLGDQTPISVILRIGGERTIITGRAVASTFPITLPQNGWIHLGPLHGEQDEALTQLIAHQVKTGQELSINPSMDMIETRSRSFLSLLKVASVLFINKAEALHLTRLPARTPIAEVLQASSRLGPKVVCLTDGESGAYLITGLTQRYAPALKTKFDRVDATGAGDAFTSGFLAMYLTNRDELEEQTLLEASLSCAIANSAASVGEIGGQAGLLTLEEMKTDAARVRFKESR